MIIQPQTPYSYDSLSEEVLLKCFSFLNLEDMPIVELVCTIWNRVSSDDFCWRPIAYERKLNMHIEIPSMRARVMRSFGPYCQAARILFRKKLNKVPKSPNSVEERKLIDTTLKDLAQIPKDLSHFGALLTSHFNDLLRNRSLITSDYLIPFIQVLLNSGTGRANDLFEGLAIIFSTKFEIPILRLAMSDEVRPNEMSEEITYVLEQWAILLRYLSTYAENPSEGSIAIFCHVYAFSGYMTALANIATHCEKKGETLDTHLHNLSGTEWNLAFEAFMKDENVDINIQIQYPDYLHKLIQNLDESKFKTLLNPSEFGNHLQNWSHGHRPNKPEFFLPTGEPARDYMAKALLERYEKSLSAIQKDKI